MIARSFALVLSLYASAACVSAPENEDWLAVGFRSPEQTFRTFQTAVRADAPELEFRCFSADFRRANGLSKLGFREGRDILRREQPFLRVGIADAEAQGPAEVRGERATLDLNSHGYALRVDFVREDFGELWAGPTALVDDTYDFQSVTGTQPVSNQRRLFFGRLPIPDGLPDADSVTEIRVGREWKIDGLRELDKPD